MILGEKIIKIRLLNNITKEQLARSLGISSQMLSFIENGKRGKLPNWFYNLPKALNCSFNDLLDDDIKKIEVDNIYISKFNNDFDVKEKIPFNKHLLKNFVKNYDNLVYIKYNSDNMSPTIAYNDDIIIDCSDRKVVDNKIYFINENNKFLIKRLFRVSPFDENIMVSNDNKNINNYPDYPINTQQAENLVIGRVVFYCRSL